METSYFICEKWLAVEKDSGEVNKLIEIQTKKKSNILLYRLIVQ
jgi:hypothetical protein